MGKFIKKVVYSEFACSLYVSFINGWAYRFDRMPPKRAFEFDKFLDNQLMFRLDGDDGDMKSYYCYVNYILTKFDHAVINPDGQVIKMVTVSEQVAKEVTVSEQVAKEQVIKDRLVLKMIISPYLPDNTILVNERTAGIIINHYNTNSRTISDIKTSANRYKSMLLIEAERLEL